MEPAPALHAYLSYRDAPAGLTWLEEVGFHVVARQDDPRGAVLHAEVRLWLPEPAAVDDWHSRAVGAGAREVIAPEDTDWGTRRSRVLDPEGHEWSVGTYRPGRPW
jgi:uncharacterized glyoxalase superfamily protein PhnB